MATLVDLTGQRYGRLLVIEKTQTHVTKGGHRIAQWLCKCDCGNKTTVPGASLRSGNTRSCGCLQRETAKNTMTTHGRSYDRLHNIWNHMKQRCGNPNDNNYEHYGAEGKTVYKPWADDFQRFYDWAMDNGYQENLTIDRIDNTKGYYPENCRWATKKQQSNNTRRNRLITLNGEAKTMSQWCEEFGIKNTTVYDRLKRGWDIESALTRKTQRYHSEKHKSVLHLQEERTL